MLRTLFVASFLTAFTIGIARGQYDGGEERDFQSCYKDKVKYAWERLNYYELLGFSKEQWTKRLDSKDVQKAFRRQARLWHPDKIKANETLTIEEINARFSTIGHAYDTLNDPDKREAYNRCLKRGKSPSYSRRPHHDPYGNPYQPNQENTNRTPSSVQIEREMLVDPMTGIPILRKTTYEEFYQENYYRISIQDFDPYHQPLYPYPQVVEEGQLYHSRHHNNRYGQQQSAHHAPRTADTLQEGGVLRAGEALFSANQQYRAQVHNCVLVVEYRRQDSEFEPEIRVVWESPNEVPRMGGWRAEAECFLALEGGQLMIAGGSPELHNGQILWFSHADNEGTYDFAPAHTYKARLENDGKFVVYRVDQFDETRETCVYATGLLGCFRLASRLVWVSVHAKEKWNGLLDSRVSERAKEQWNSLLDLLSGNREESSNQGQSHYRDGYYDSEKNITRFWVQTALQTLANVNRARRRIEVYLEGRSLQMVYDVESWWQKRRQNLKYS